MYAFVSHTLHYSTHRNNELRCLEALHTWPLGPSSPLARMRSEGYNTWSVCMSLSLCLSVCLSVSSYSHTTGYMSDTNVF